MGIAKNNFWVLLSVPHLVDNYAKFVDGRGRNLMCHRTLPSRLVCLYIFCTNADAFFLGAKYVFWKPSFMRKMLAPLMKYLLHFCKVHFACKRTSYLHMISVKLATQLAKNSKNLTDLGKLENTEFRYFKKMFITIDKQLGPFLQCQFTYYLKGSLNHPLFPNARKDRAQNSSNFHELQDNYHPITSLGQTLHFIWRRVNAERKKKQWKNWKYLKISCKFFINFPKIFVIISNKLCYRRLLCLRQLRISPVKVFKKFVLNIIVHGSKKLSNKRK